MSAFRAELKSWIERSKAGEDIVITERGVPVARLSAVGCADLITELVQEGLLSLPASPRAEPPAAVAGESGPATESKGAVAALFSRRRR
ncbi:prevent-host-death family protein [Rarobacter incanus]|uniref:Prevent-host-death family protein n=1 Tax=Rarobacter incanus TaxID=153494 RepID=A0A542SQ80_9MICO|nr:prevent-host-death family protein [Rarobacter incanus]